jgi:hypothetical protein
MLCLYWPLGTVVITGPKVLDFYAAFCAHRATCLKADGKEIKVLNLILSGDSDGTNETDPSKGLKTKGTAVALYLNRRLRSQVIPDLNTVNYCT